MKILIPILGFGRAGGYRVLSQLATEWINQGHNVDFLCPDSSETPYFPTSAGILYISSTQGITCQRAIRSKSGIRYKLQALFNGLLRIGKRYDIILANDSLTTWPVSFASCGNAKKFYYIQAYEPEYFSLIKNIKSTVLKWFSEKSYDFNIIQICNAPIYIGYKNISAKEWVPPGIDFDLFYPNQLDKKNLALAEEIILGCIGRHEPSKGIQYALEAFEILYLKDQRFRLYVAFGNLPLNWTHPGLKVVMPENDKELGAFYRSLDILLAPGTVQLGAPHYPVMEGMACGVSVVNTGYLPANNNNSWIIEICSASSIVAAVNNILSDSNRNIKINKSLEDIASFNWESVAKKMISVFDNSRFTTKNQPI